MRSPAKSSWWVSSSAAAGPIVAQWRMESSPGLGTDQVDPSGPMRRSGEVALSWIESVAHVSPLSKSGDPAWRPGCVGVDAILPQVFKSARIPFVHVALPSATHVTEENPSISSCPGKPSSTSIPETGAVLESCGASPGSVGAIWLDGEAPPART